MFFGTRQIFGPRDNEPNERDLLALAVAELWAKHNGWIPGGAIQELEAVLDLPLPQPCVGSYDPTIVGMTYNQDKARRGPGETYEQWRERQTP